MLGVASAVAVVFDAYPYAMSLYHVFVFSILSDLNLLRLAVYLAPAQMDQCHFFGHLWVWHYALFRAGVIWFGII